MILQKLAKRLLAKAVDEEEADMDESQLAKIPDNVIRASIKLLLQNTQAIRDMVSVLFWTVLMPATALVVTSMKNASVQYNEDVESAGSGHEFGPPNVHVFMGMLHA